jgi:DNA polymerase
MPSEANSLEFLALLKDARERVIYFKELGIEGTDQVDATFSGSPGSRETTPVTLPSDLQTKQAVAPSVAQFSRKPASNALAATKLFGDSPAAVATLPKSTETFADIWAEIGNCTRCPLYERRTHIVHTDGNQNARLMFVGEAPGADEDAQAKPFVGRAGQLLTKIIEAIGFKREEVLIGNVNRCRPPGNRPPTPEEVAMCKPFLLREIAAVQPEVIVVLGNTAMRNLLDIKQGITKVRGEFQDYHGVKVMPTFHPAYLLRDPSKKKETWEDLKKVRDYLDSTRK